MMDFFLVFLLAFASPAAGFLLPRSPLLGPSQRALVPVPHLQKLQTPRQTAVPGSGPTPLASPVSLAMAKRDASRSGTRRERLDKLAALEEERVETDTGFVLKAAGAFVGLIVLLLVGAFASGLFNDVI